jgi:hypothetical protein
MPIETSQQIDMFSGELKDTRTRRQREQDKQRDLPQPTLMFKQNEVVQFGVKARPIMPIADNARLALQHEDYRTEEERESDLRHEAEAKTYLLFISDKTDLLDTTTGNEVSPSNANNNSQMVFNEQDIDEELFLFYEALQLRLAFSMF